MLLIRRAEYLEYSDTSMKAVIKTLYKSNKIIAGCFLNSILSMILNNMLYFLWSI